MRTLTLPPHLSSNNLSYTQKLELERNRKVNDIKERVPDNPDLFRVFVIKIIHDNPELTGIAFKAYKGEIPNQNIHFESFIRQVENQLQNYPIALNYIQEWWDDKQASIVLH
jgi:hypothetical protein